MEKSEQVQKVNHVAYYNSNESGVECIDVIRNMPFNIGNSIKYLWRQGLKKETGMDERQKAAEDLNKAMWYIRDYIEFTLNQHCEFNHESELNK